ncbi:contractile injection system tape measure protein [Pandoraea oxalativorans]|uniref:Uncharacterized protein n=1 Tax=Pandoraea oxalativorans TaxID=573737 RepID=A0A0E3YCN2_9BURK|nr:contractile injection system tape measure protein [Pandoraea oxalativorans]AKC70815.1 hypothetical protein MB84_17020 [Pandoraea oxalativorans]
MDTRHRIRSLDFDLTFASGGMAMSQGEPLRALVVDQLLPVVASVLDEATGDGATADIYRIDRLDVDLGEVYDEDLPETLAERLAQALASVLVMQQNAGAAASATHAADLIAFLASGHWATPGVGPAPAQTERGDASGPDDEMRWDTDAGVADARVSDGLEALLARVLAGDIQTVRQRIRANASPDTLIQRLTKQFPAHGVDALLRALRPAEASGWLRQLDALDQLLATVGWNVTQRADAQSAARARLLAMGLLPPDASLRAMPWHGVWQSVLSIAQTRGLARDAFDFVAKVRGSVRADEARASAIDATRADETSQAGSESATMLDALHRVADAHASGEETPPAFRGKESDGPLYEQVPTANASPRPFPFTQAGLKALLSTALMRAQAKPLYGIWPTLVTNEADTLREALRRYLSVSDLREQIALTFPVSMLEDMLALLLAARPEATQESAQASRRRADAYGVGRRPESTVHDMGRTWAWRNAWSHDIAAAAGISDAEVMRGIGLRDEAQPDVPAVPAASFDVRVGADVALSGRHEASTVSPSGDSIPDDPSDTLTHRSVGDEATSAEPAARAPEPAIPPAVPLTWPAADDVDARAEVTSRNDRLIRALLSGSAVALQDDWADWIGRERHALASIWRRYSTYDTVLMRVVEGFPETMLVDLATVTVPSAAALWEALAGISVDRLADAEQASASTTEPLLRDPSLVGSPGLADAVGVETHAESNTRNIPSQTDLDRWKREVWHALFMQLRTVSPVASTSSTSSMPSISSVSFAALEAIALPRGRAAWARRAFDLWGATVTADTTDSSDAIGSSGTIGSPGTVAPSPRVADSMAADGHVLRAPTSSIADAASPASVAEPMGRRTSTVAIRRLVRQRQKVNPQGGDLIARAASLSAPERLDLRRIVTEIASTRGSDLAGIDAHHWQAVVDTMIAVSESIPDAHREVLYRSILDNAPDIEGEVDVSVFPPDATGRYYASVAAALAADAVLDLDLLAESAIAQVASSSPDDPDFNAPSPFPPTSPNRPPAMPEDFIAYLTSTDFRRSGTPPAGFDIWLRQSVYSGAHVLRPIIAMAAEDEALAERWLDLIAPPLWPGIARLSSRDTPQVAQMLRVASDITDLFATSVETVAPASLHRARWRFLFPWLFLPQRAFDAAAFATSLVAELARHANVAVPPALASRVQQQTGIDMRTADVTDNAHLLQIPLTVPYAGIVLTWPFTSQLWNRLGLTREHRFVSDEAAERAMLLLHYVGSGLTEAPEPHLTMHKLLCGLPFTSPVARHLDITADESAICDQMLDVIIQHWSALGNTSRDGLRESFLQREGRLSLAEDGWHLKVRRAPYDMLLDRLPWSISTIRLSWMEQTLWVEWA